nr:putative capsid protein [Poaceae Liege totivirus 11]
MMHESHQLNTQVSVFDRPRAYMAILDPKWQDYTSNNVLNTIVRYVEGHRYFACFDMAYGMLTQVLYRHKPRSAESIIWSRKPEVMNLSKAYSIRGALPSLFSGTPFVTSTARVATYDNWRRQPMRILVHSMALSEAVHCSTFDNVTRRRWVPQDRDEYKEPNVLGGMVGAAPVKTCGLIKELTLAGLRFNKSFNAPWACQNGLVRYNWMEKQTIDLEPMDLTLLDPASIAAYGLVAHEQLDAAGNVINTTYTMPMKTIPPCCYPVFSMEINKNNYYMNDLELETTLKWDRDLNRYTTKETVIAHKFMSAMRVAGYNVTAERHSDRALYTNWSANADGHYMPTFSKNYRQEELYMFSPRNIVPRANNWVDMTLLGHMLKTKLKFTYKTFQIYNDDVAYVAVFDDFITLDRPVSDYKIADMTNRINYAQYVVEKPDMIKDYEDFRVIANNAPAVLMGQIGPNLIHRPVIQDEDLGEID